MTDEPGLVPPGAPGPAAPAAPAGPWAAAAPPYPQAHPPAYGPAPGRPLHKPGTIPLRPLTLTDFFDGAFTTVRRNPRATIGMAALVTAAFMLVPILGSLAASLTGLFDGVLDLSPSGDGMAGTALLQGASVLSGLFGALANIVVAGLVVPVVTRAAVGEQVTTGQSWGQVRRRVPALIGLAGLELLVALVVLALTAGLGVTIGLVAGSIATAVVLGILLGLVGLVGVVAIHMKWFQLAAPALVVERRGVLDAVRRAGRLSGGSFWRITGITLLTGLLTGLIGQVIGFPFGLIGAIGAVAMPDPFGPLVLLLSSNLSTVVSGAIVAPFTGTVAVLQYLDQRFRREGFDLELITYVQRRSAP